MDNKLVNNKAAYILAIDEGTTNTKAVAINQKGEILAKASRTLNVTTPNPSWVEQDGDMIIKATLAAIDELINSMNQPNIQGKLQGIAISNQRESVIAWERTTNKAISPAITWQCSRGSKFCESINAHKDKIQTITGLPLAPLFSASKMRWILDNIQNGHARAQAGEICLGTIDSWLLWNLTGGQSFKTDVSNASRTQLLNLNTQDFDPEMLEIFGIKRAALAQVCPSSGYFGKTTALGNIPDGIPIYAMLGDSHAALYGHGAGAAGVVKATFGTGSSIMAEFKNQKDQNNQDLGLARTIAWHDGAQIHYALEANIAHTGDAVGFITELLNLKNDPVHDALAHDQNKTLSDLYASIPASINSTQGVYFVPALTGLGAPHWDASARGCISGLTRGTNRAHLVRAALESIAYQIKDVIEVMEQDKHFVLTTLMVDGGPTRNDWLMQFQADLLGCRVARSDMAELSALGAGLLAWKALKQLDQAALADMLPPHQYFYPNPEKEREMAQNYLGWKKAVRNILS